VSAEFFNGKNRQKDEISASEETHLREISLLQILQLFCPRARKTHSRLWKIKGGVVIFSCLRWLLSAIKIKFRATNFLARGKLSVWLNLIVQLFPAKNCAL